MKELVERHNVGTLVKSNEGGVSTKVEESLDEYLPGKRKTMEIMKCPHKNAKHYAKGMCNHCYHKYGRNSYADACPHTDRLVYAKGKCQNCYLNDYNKQKRRLKKDKMNGELV